MTRLPRSLQGTAPALAVSQLAQLAAVQSTQVGWRLDEIQ